MSIRLNKIDSKQREIPSVALFVIMVEIIDLPNHRRSDYDRYISRTPTGLPQHLSGWQEVLRHTYGYQTRFLAAVQNQTIVGALPLFLINSPLLGRTVRSMPGGLAGDSDGVAAALLDEANRWAKHTAARRLHIADSRHAWSHAALQCRSQHVTWRKALRSGEDAVWRQLDGNIRRQVRIARKNRLTVRIDREREALRPFYKIFLQFAHQSGTPLYGLTFLENVVAAFPDRYSIALVYQQKRPLGGYFQLDCGDTVYGLWGAALPQFLKLRPVYLAYWEIMSDAMQRGFCWLDMGRSPVNANASRFKAQWGGLSQPVYQLSTTLGDTQQHGNRSPQPSERFGLLARCWPYLPRPVAKHLGPKLRKHMPFA